MKDEMKYPCSSESGWSVFACGRIENLCSSEWSISAGCKVKNLCSSEWSILDCSASAGSRLESQEGGVSLLSGIFGSGSVLCRLPASVLLHSLKRSALF